MIVAPGRRRGCFLSSIQLLNKVHMEVLVIFVLLVSRPAKLMRSRSLHCNFGPSPSTLNMSDMRPSGAALGTSGVAPA